MLLLLRLVLIVADVLIVTVEVPLGEIVIVVEGTMLSDVTSTGEVDGGDNTGLVSGFMLELLFLIQERLRDALKVVSEVMWACVGEREGV